jgi:polyferredoxin
MGRDRLLSAAIVVFLGIGTVSAGVNAFVATDAVVPVLPLLVRLVAYGVGLVLAGYVLVREELTERQRPSGVGTVAGGASIAVSGAIIAGTAEFGAAGPLWGSLTFLAGVITFLYGATVLFGFELTQPERQTS